MKPSARPPVRVRPQMATVKIPPVLRPAVSGKSEVEVPGATVGDILDGLAEQHPDTRGQLCTGEGFGDHVHRASVKGLDPSG